MAGGKYQEMANRFIERMECYVKGEAEDMARQASSETPRKHDMWMHADKGSTQSQREMQEKKLGEIHSKHQPTSHNANSATQQGFQPQVPMLKKPRHQQNPHDQQGSLHGGVRRVHCPSAILFQQEYMETATPVILTGVRSIASLHFRRLRFLEGGRADFTPSFSAEENVRTTYYDWLHFCRMLV